MAKEDLKEEKEKTEEVVEQKEENKAKKPSKKKKSEEKTEEKIESKEEKSEAKEEKAEAKEEKKKAKKEEKELKDEGNLLIPLEDYIKSGIHLGTKVITAQMKPYIFRRRADGLAILNTNQIDARIRIAAAFLAQYAPEKIVVSCKREAGWKAIEKFSEVTGIKVFSKKYPAGIITNLALPHFFEPSLMIIIDPWIDKNPMLDAVKIHIPVIALCDSNNVPSKIDLIIPANNKSNKSIGIIFWILAREYNKARGKEITMPPYEEFIGESI